jgi:hypothetical protein
VKFRNETERQIFAAAYVADFQDSHRRGVHAEFRRREDAGEIRPEDTVRLWEEAMADNAIGEAEGLVRMFRIGAAARRRRGT